MRFLTALLTAALTLTPAFASSHGMQKHHTGLQSPFEAVITEGLTFDKFWARARIGMAPNSAIYGLVMMADGADRLVRAETPVAERVELHEHIKDQGVMRMREVDGGFKLDSNTPLHMKPGGYHIMLLGLTGSLDAGSEFPLTLHFESGLVIDLKVPVLAGPAMKH